MIKDLLGCDHGRVVADVNVLAKAGAQWIAARGRWPKVPPDLRPLDAAAIAICADADEWQLWVSDELLRLTAAVLRGQIGNEFADESAIPAGDVDRYLAELEQVVEDSRGGRVRPRLRVTNLVGDSEDDANVASLAASVKADVVISWDSKVRGLGLRALPVEHGLDKEVRFVSCGDFVQHVHNVRTAQGGW